MKQVNIEGKDPISIEGKDPIFYESKQQAQTAVEWLIEQLEWDDSKIARVIGLKKYNQVVNQAKKMEKEQGYNEEDMKFAYEQGARLALLSQTDLARHKGEFPNPEEWFNKFKNK